MWFLCILRWGKLTGLLTSVFSQTNLVLGFTTSGIKPKIEFQLSSDFSLQYQYPIKSPIALAYAIFLFTFIVCVRAECVIGHSFNYLEIRKLI